MEYSYAPVKTVENGETESIKSKHIIRQIFVSSGPWTIYFVTGLYFGTPAVMIPQLRKEANSTAVVSDEMESWLSSIFGYSSLPWTLILPILSELYGRKLPFKITFIFLLIGYTIWYFSSTITYILIAEIMVSITCSCNATLCVIILVEYTAPKYRGVLLTMKSAMFFWGVWVANTIGSFYHWKKIVILGFLCSAYNATSFFWPESPYWLATQERFEECAASHRFLKGTNKEAENELEQLINSQKKFSETNSTHKILFSWSRLVSFFKVFSLKVVYKPIFISLVNIAMYHLSGKLACSTYAIGIIKRITGLESTAYKGMLILDAVSVFGMYFGCYLSKKLKRRTLLFCTTFSSVLFLFTLSLYLYLIQNNFVLENNIISLSLLTFFSLSISCGPMLLSLSIFAELMPLRYKGSAVIAISIANNIILSTVIKISPFIFKKVGLHGGFMFYGICVLVCVIILFKYLPETKDKTLIEIEDYFRK